MIERSSYLCKVDLKMAYRSVTIKEGHRTLTGLKWLFSGSESPSFLQDCKLPFGARKSPAIFNRLTQAVKRMMARRGFQNCSVYLDDFLIAEPDFEKCAMAMNTLIKLLRSLGFRINWKKVVDPRKDLVFLGVHINSVTGELHLDPEKSDKLCQLLALSLTRSRLTKAQLETLAGKLSWAANVVTWGRTHINSFFQLIRTLKGKRHKARMTPLLRTDIQWWLNCLRHGKNTRLMWAYRPPVCITTDSSGAAGGAFHHNGDWLYCNWLLDRPGMANEHINIKELAMMQEAIC